MHGERRDTTSYKGKVPWNKGLTKEKDSRVMANAIACRKPKSNTENMGRYKRKNNAVAGGT